MKIRRYSTYAALWLFLAVPSMSEAQQTDPISTDRPSFSASPNSVGENIWVLETGYLYTRNSSGSSSQSLPNVLLRFGLSDETELRMQWTGYTRNKNGSSTKSGYSDLSLGAKWQINDSTSSTLFALLAELSVPTGDNSFGSDSYDPKLSLAWSSSSSLQWFGTASLAHSDGSETFSNGIGLSFAIDESSAWFVEHQMDLPGNGSTAHQLNGGISLLRNHDMQFDLHGSLGLNDHAADYSLGAGWSIRF
jgi:hypothetical protein